MGCVSSKPDINDQHPNIFQVSNVNEHLQSVSPGKLEVTETELILHQRSKPPTVWPLRALRKYGFDSDIFSFECGRRSPTGYGIYAFRCLKAEQLFNLVQQHIIRNSTDENFPIPTVSTGPPVQRRPDTYLTPRPSISLSRPGSIVSNGPVSPTNISPPPILVEDPLEHNNNQQEPVLSYANLPVTSPTLPNVDESHLYMNVDTDTKESSDAKHCYANIDTKDVELLASVPATPTAIYVPVLHEVNYAELDLDKSDSSQTTQITPESPTKEKKGYVTIDFEKTSALSQSINPGIDVEEGSRKTRHNSTISDVTTTKQSNSLSD